MAWVEEEDMPVHHVVVSFSLVSQVTVPLTNYAQYEWKYVVPTPKQKSLNSTPAMDVIYLHQKQKQNWEKRGNRSKPIAEVD